MRLIFAICFLRIASSLGCATVTDVLSETDFENIISDGKWQVMYKFNKLLDPTALYTEFQFFGGFPYVCRIKQRCFEQMNFTRNDITTARITMNGAGLNFYVYNIDTEGNIPGDKLTETYSYAVYKYEPNRLLILYTCTQIHQVNLYGLLVLYKADAKALFGGNIGIETSLTIYPESEEISDNVSVFLDNRLSCSDQFLDLYYKQNDAEKNFRGNWRFALANLVLGKILLQISRH